VNAEFVDMSIPFAAGALYSTTADLLRWEQGLFGGKLLSATSLQKMTTPFKNDYAFGLSIMNVNGHKAIYHNGAINGFNAVLAYYPEEKLTVAVLGNLNGDAPERIAAKLALAAFGESVEQSANPGTEAAVRRIIEELRSGMPNYDLMTPQMANVTRQQLSQLQAIVRQLGAVRSVKFDGVGPGGTDIYVIRFDNGSLEYRIRLTPDGKLDTAAIRPVQ
jgi:hypothetical protein